MTKILEAIHDNLLMEAKEAKKASSMEPAQVGVPNDWEERNKEVSQTYKITGKRRILDKLEAIFDMINEASDEERRSDITIELTLSLGGKDGFSNSLKIKKADSRKPLTSSASELFINKKANVYI